MTGVVTGWTCFDNVDAIKHVWCPWCGAAPGKLCVKGQHEDYLNGLTLDPNAPNTVKVHGMRALHFRRWANDNGFVPNHMVAENDKDLRIKAAE